MDQPLIDKGRLADQPSVCRNHLSLVDDNPVPRDEPLGGNLNFLPIRKQPSKPAPLSERRQKLSPQPKLGGPVPIAPEGHHPGHERRSQELPARQCSHDDRAKERGQSDMPLLELAPGQLDHVEVGCHKQHGAWPARGLARRARPPRPARRSQSPGRILPETDVACVWQSGRCLECAIEKMGQLRFSNRAGVKMDEQARGQRPDVPIAHTVGTFQLCLHSVRQLRIARQTRESKTNSSGQIAYNLPGWTGRTISLCSCYSAIVRGF